MEFIFEIRGTTVVMFCAKAIPNRIVVQRENREYESVRRLEIKIEENYILEENDFVYSS